MPTQYAQEPVRETLRKRKDRWDKFAALVSILQSNSRKTFSTTIIGGYLSWPSREQCSQQVQPTHVLKDILRKNDEAFLQEKGSSKIMNAKNSLWLPAEILQGEEWNAYIHNHNKIQWNAAILPNFGFVRMLNKINFLINLLFDPNRRKTTIPDYAQTKACWITPTCMVIEQVRSSSVEREDD